MIPAGDSSFSVPRFSRFSQSCGVITLAIARGADPGHAAEDPAEVIRIRIPDVTRNAVDWHGSLSDQFQGTKDTASFQMPHGGESRQILEQGAKVGG